MEQYWQFYWFRWLAINFPSLGNYFWQCNIWREHRSSCSFVIVVYRETAGATGCKSRKRPESAARKSEKGHTLTDVYTHHQHTCNAHCELLAFCREHQSKKWLFWLYDTNALFKYLYMYFIYYGCVSCCCYHVVDIGDSVSRYWWLTCTHKDTHIRKYFINWYLESFKWCLWYSTRKFSNLIWLD